MPSPAKKSEPAMVGLSGTGDGSRSNTVTNGGANAVTSLSCPDAAVLAAHRGEEKAVLAWLEGGGRVDATYERDGVSGVTLLMGAAHKGHERVVELLLRHGAKINQQNSGGEAAL